MAKNTKYAVCVRPFGPLLVWIPVTFTLAARRETHSAWLFNKISQFFNEFNKEKAVACVCGQPWFGLSPPQPHAGLLFWAAEIFEKEKVNCKQWLSTDGKVSRQNLQFLYCSVLLCNIRNLLWKMIVHLIIVYPGSDCQNENSATHCEWLNRNETRWKQTLDLFEPLGRDFCNFTSALGQSCLSTVKGHQAESGDPVRSHRVVWEWVCHLINITEPIV